MKMIFETASFLHIYQVLISIVADAFRGQDFSRFPRLRSVQGLQFMLIPLESPPSWRSTILPVTICMKTSVSLISITTFELITCHFINISEVLVLTCILHNLYLLFPFQY